MANRIKEDERNERIIRNLLKLSDNRRCINCNSLGPQYVCTNFSTFVCTTCSGIHREFTHRVKSVSMAKFTSQEVSALQGGGNASAKEIYLKEWDPQRQSVPDSSNVEKLRDFIKHVYVDRRYTGERSSDKPPRVKMGETEDFSENRKPDPYQGGSRSPPYEDTYEQRRHSDRPSPGGRSDDRNYRNNYDERRSPGSDSDFRSPARTEIVNDWRRDDRFGNGRRSEDNNRISEGGSKLEGRSPDRQRDLDISSPPIIRPVRDILGDNVSPLRIIEPPKGDDRRSADTSARTQRTASSSSLASSNGNPAELRTETSLIDFDDIPEPPLSAAVPQTQQTATSTSSNDNWANFDSVTEVQVSKAPSNANLLESVLSELTVTAPVSYNNPLVTSTGNISVSPFGSGAPAVSSASNSMAFPHGGAPSGQTFDAFGNVADRGQWHAVHPQQRTVHPQQPFLFPMAHSQPPAQPFTPAVGGASSNQPWNPLLTPNMQGPSNPLASHPPQVVSRPAVQVTSGLVAQPTHVELRPTAKKELPEDLFATNYLSHPATIPGWQNGPPHGIGFNMQYNMSASVPTFPQSSKSTNPFDFNNDPSPVQAPTFPSMASLQGALPNMGTPSQTWMPPQSSHPLAMPPQAPSYAPAMPPQAPSYAPAMPPGSYMGQKVPPNMSLRPLGFGIEQAAYGSFNPNQQQSGIYSAPANPNTFSSAGGNPFG